MLYQSMFPRALFADMARLQQQMDQLFEVESNIRGIGRGGFPALNIGATPEALECYAFVPGLDPSQIEISVEQGVLTIAGERAEERSGDPKAATMHLNERFHGKFKRIVSLPEDIDADSITAQYRDGVLHITAKRRASMQPRRISVH
jgi:HSP20 family protein